MYSTCLYCSRPLGRNGDVQAFPVGRRLAFDAERGRLWVVCARCERWNLSPFETRWEAVEECARRFRAARLRVATEYVGMARLPGGTELVAIGAAPRAELAGWRYGDQFGRRRRRTLIDGGVLAASAGALALGSGAGLLGLAYATLVVAGTAWPEGPKRARLSLGGGERVELDYLQLHHLRLVPGRKAPAWGVEVPRLGVLTGRDAVRGMDVLLPAFNRHGGSARTVRRAVALLEQAGGVHPLFHQAAERGSELRRYPPALRLALEMAAHEARERAALEGELAELERDWREAEEVAAIADRLAAPGLGRLLRRLRRARGP